MEQITVMGLMAGTSVDGIDAALIKTDGLTVSRTGHALTGSYDPVTREAIFAAFDSPFDHADDLAFWIARDHARVAEMVIAESGIMPDLIGFHGQTIYHAPGVSLQLGDAQYLSRRLGVPVIHQFRKNDLENGGQGAPIAPIYHKTLIAELKLSLPAAFVNIGGISNASILTNFDDGGLMGLDLGPGNGLMDDLARRYLGKDFDLDGCFAETGAVNEAIVDAVMTGDFFKIVGPKSLDRKGLDALIPQHMLAGLAEADQMATLLSITAESVVCGLMLNCPSVKNIVVTGGGSFNPALLRALVDRAKNITVFRSEDFALDSRFIEAELIGYLAGRAIHDLPITFPETTGVDQPRSGGILASASDQGV